MKKISTKGLVAAVVLTALVCTIGAGTYAKYVFGARSENNVVRAASFEVGLGDADQMKSARFSLDKFNSFSEPVEYPITINKNNTEVPVKYELSVNIDETDKGLFEGESPIKMELLRKAGNDYQVVVPDFLHNAYALNDLHYDENLRPAATEEFKVRCSWVTKSDEVDTTYQGKTGKFDVIFNAEQTKDHIEEPYEPEINTLNNREVAVNMFKRRDSGNFDRIIYNSKTTLNEIKYYKDKDGKRIVEFGDVVVKGWNTEINIKIGNLKFTETNVNSCEYAPSYVCKKDGWDNKVFKFNNKINPRKGIYSIRFEHTNDASSYPATDSISITTDLKEGRSIINWFK